MRRLRHAMQEFQERVVLTVLALLTLAACGAGGGGSGSTSTPAPVVDPNAPAEYFHTVSSSYTGISYDVVVRTPQGYTGLADRRPVIYAPDREFQHVPLASAVDQQNLGAVIVSVGQISSARRFVDYSGAGAAAYYRFLTLELAPFIETRYGVDTARRSLVGYSLSGLFATLGFLLDNPAARFYSGILTSDPSMQIDTVTAFGLETALADSTRRVAVRYGTCYTASGPWVEFNNQLVQRNYEGFTLRQQRIAVTHGEIHLRCIPDYLRFVVGG